MSSEKQRPHDFDEVYKRLGSNFKTAMHYQVDRATSRRWRDRREVFVKTCKPTTDDFRRTALTMTRAELARHYKADSSVIRRWIMQTDAVVKVAPFGYSSRNIARAIPDGFAAAVPLCTQAQLMVKYGATHGVVKRWIRECGGTPRVQARPGRAPGQHWTKPEVRLQRPETDSRPHTIHSQAVRVLGKYGPAYSCDEKGKANPGGKFWRIGRVVVDGDELLRRAARYQVAA